MATSSPKAALAKKSTAAAAKAAPAPKAAKSAVASAKGTKPAAKPLVKAAPKTAQKPVAKAASKVVKAAKAVKSKKDVRRVYVLDTNVLLHDPYSPLKFKEHYVYIPMVTIEELDNKKQGTTDVNRNARSATRLLEDITSQTTGSIDDGFPLEEFNNGTYDGRLFLQNKVVDYVKGETVRKNDNLYLGVLEHLVGRFPDFEVVMVTKDLNLRIKSRAQGFRVEDYRHDHISEDAKFFARGIHEKSKDWLTSFGDDLKCEVMDGITFYTLPALEGAMLNEFIYLGQDGQFDPKQLFTIIKVENEKMVLEQTSSNISAFGVKPRNEEQQAALALLTDPDIDLVALLGPAGTGKTLLTLAAGLQQTIAAGETENLFDEVIFTRATVALGEDVGYLPGNEEEKMMPWLGAMNDNLEVLAEGQNKGKAAHATNAGRAMLEKVKDVVKARAITFMRGRTFQRKLLILDEAQNLTPKQVKALITRAGNGTKVICMGNLAQIDSPYLSEQSSGLAYLMQRFKGWKHFGAIVLEKGERSRLATEANTRL